MQRLSLLATLIIIIFLTSCTSYYYSVLDTNDPYTYKNDRGEFVIGSDSLYIVYNFSGENAPVKISIHNQMNMPVFVDWRHSGISLNNISAATFKKQIKIRGVRADADEIDFGRFQTDPTGMTYIAPYSVLETKMIELTGFSYHKISNDDFKDRYINTKKNGKEKEFKSIEYNEENTPFFLRSYLTLYRDTQKEYDPIFFETDFYQSKVINGYGNAPIEMHNYRNKRGNFFYCRVKRGKVFEQAGNTSLKILGGAALATGYLFLNANEE